MKFIIIGLGTFGSTLAVKLTQLGHEVMGVDKKIEKIEDIKDKITHAICLDCKHQNAINSLPIKNTDVVIVSIGEDEGANLLTTAFIKKLNVPRLICRAVSPIHATILEAMDISEIMRPEEETADRWAKKLTTAGIIDSFELADNYSVVQVEIPKKFVGRTIGEIGINQIYRVLVLTVMKSVKEKGLFGIQRKTSKLHIEGVANAQTHLEAGDVMVLYGHNDDIFKLLKSDKV